MSLGNVLATRAVVLFLSKTRRHSRVKPKKSRRAPAEQMGIAKQEKKNEKVREEISTILYHGSMIG